MENDLLHVRSTFKCISRDFVDDLRELYNFKIRALAKRIEANYVNRIGNLRRLERTAVECTTPHCCSFTRQRYLAASFRIGDQAFFVLGVKSPIFRCVIGI